LTFANGTAKAGAFDEELHQRPRLLWHSPQPDHGGARDQAGICGDNRRFRATETGLSRVYRAKAPGS